MDVKKLSINVFSSTIPLIPLKYCTYILKFKDTNLLGFCDVSINLNLSRNVHVTFI